MVIINILLLIILDSPQAPAHPDIMIFENVRRNCIRVMNEGFQTHVINVSSLTDVSQVIELIHQKFRLQNNLKNDYAIYLRESDNLNEARKITNEELWAICSGCNSYARSNLLVN